MTMITTAACVVCGATAGHEDRLDGQLRRCGHCGFTWTAATLASTEDLYQDGEYFQGGGYEDYYIPSARRFEARRRIRWLFATGRPGSLIEAGSAGGYFVEAARQAGVAAEGIEVAGPAVRYAQDVLGVPVRQGLFEEVVVDRSYDVVCAFHVLEHVEQLDEFLRTARRALVPGGRLAIEVPNVESGMARRLGPHWMALDLRHHRWHFGPDSLTRLVTAHGFDVIQRDTTVVRFYMPMRYRMRRMKDQLLPDLLSMRSPRLTHPSRGDMLRLIARRAPDRRPG